MIPGGKNRLLKNTGRDVAPGRVALARPVFFPSIPCSTELPENVSAQSRGAAPRGTSRGGEGPKFAALFAGKWGGREYPGGALFTVRVVDGKDLRTAGKLRVFHGFGQPVIAWRGKDYEVAREEIITLQG